MLLSKWGKRIFTPSCEKPVDDKCYVQLGISGLGSLTGRRGVARGSLGQRQAGQEWEEAIASRMSHSAVFLFIYGLGAIQGDLAAALWLQTPAGLSEQKGATAPAAGRVGRPSEADENTTL